MSEIIGEKITIGKLFGDDYFFSIPEYQRPYSWQKDNCYQLFDDIYESDRNNEYFLGTVILQKTSMLGIAKQYDIIDGQQRITTLQVLLACLRDRMKSEGFIDSLQKKIYQKEDLVDGLPEIVRLRVREKEFFKEYIQEKNGTQKVDEFEPINNAQENFINAVHVFRERIEKLSQNEIEKLIQHISQRCILICVSTDDFNNAFRLFTIINDRGLQLRRIDILKTNNLEPNAISNEVERKVYSHHWETMENELGADEFENLISYIRTILIKEKAKEDILKEFNNIVFGKNMIKKGKEFIDVIYNYKNIYDRLIVEKEVDLGKNTIAYKNLIHLMKDFLPSNEWIPPFLAYYKKFNSNNLFEFLMRLENKVVADWVIALTPAKRTVNINFILKTIDESKTSADVLNSASLQYDKGAFINELGQDIYGKRHDKYILMKLDYLEAEQDIERIYSTISVEHVLPQTPKSNSIWLKMFDENSRGQYTNKICNLVLLSKSKNSQAKNYEFEEKKKKYIEGRSTGLIRTLKLLAIKEWTPNVLAMRQEAILNIFSNQYNI